MGCADVHTLGIALLLLCLHGKLGTRGARILTIGGPGAGGEEAAPAPSHAPPVAEPPSSWAPGPTRAALEWVWQADSGARIDDGGVCGVADILGVTRRKKGAVERSVWNIFFKSEM